MSSAPATVTINVAPVNDVPFITSSPAAHGDRARDLLVHADRVGPGRNDASPFAAPKLPAWLKFMPPATITGVPEQKDGGVHDVTMTVSDGIAAPVAQSFQITVQVVDDPPQIAPIPDQTATERVPFTLDLAKLVTDPDTPASGVAFTASGALPAGACAEQRGRGHGRRDGARRLHGELQRPRRHHFRARPLQAHRAARGPRGPVGARERRTGAGRRSTHRRPGR